MKSKQDTQLEQNLQMATKAIEHVRAQLKFGTNAKKDSEVAQLNLIKEIRKEINEKNHTYNKWHGHDASKIEQLKFHSKAMERVGYGHCGELAAAAFTFLHESGVKKLDFCLFPESRHNFVVIGRAKESRSNDINTWGPDAVVCDVWAEKAYPLSELPQQQKEPSVEYADSFQSLAELQPDTHGFLGKHYLTGQLQSECRSTDSAKVAEEEAQWFSLDDELTPTTPPPKIPQQTSIPLASDEEFREDDDSRNDTFHI